MTFSLNVNNREKDVNTSLCGTYVTLIYIIMADWDEIKRLAADFQKVQLSSTAQR